MYGNIKTYISSTKFLKGVPSRMPKAIPDLKNRSSRKSQLQYPDSTAMAYNTACKPMMTSRRFSRSISMTTSRRWSLQKVAVGSETALSQTPGYALPLLAWKRNAVATADINHTCSLRPNYNLEFRAWTSNYIYLNIGVIAHQCPKLPHWWTKYRWR